MNNISGYIRNPTTSSPDWGYKITLILLFNNSGLPSERINLSPFTKDFRGGGHSNECALNLFAPSSEGFFKKIFLNDIKYKAMTKLSGTCK